MFDLKVINSVLEQLQEERGIPREKMIEAIELALATAYKKEYGKRGQIVRAKFNPNTGSTEFSQVKVVVDPTMVYSDEEAEEAHQSESDERVRFNPEHHIMIEDARYIKRDAALAEELIFPLEIRDEYSRIAAQTAKQVIIQKIREAERVSVMSEFGAREGEVVTGTVERVERGTIYVDLGRAVGMLPYEEQIPGERFRQGERIRAYLYRVEESPRGVFLRLSRSHPRFLEELFRSEVPEIAAGTVKIKAIAREAGSRSKVAAVSADDHVDPVGALVGQRGVRVGTITSELSGEKIDIIEWYENPTRFLEEALNPARTVSITLDEAEHKATVLVTEDQQSLAIGKGGQNVRLAAKLTGWKIDIRPSDQSGGEIVSASPDEGKEESAPVADDVAEESPSEEIAESTEAVISEEEAAEEGLAPEGEATTEEAPSAEATDEQ
jgi:N utilization substance protein A